MLALLAVSALPAEGRIVQRDLTVLAAVFELLGLYMVAVAYLRLRKEFGRDGVRKLIAKYFVDLCAALWPAKGKVISAIGSSGAEATANARAELRPGPRTPLHTRVDILEQSLRHLTAEVIQVTKDLAAQDERLSAEVRAERQARIEAERGSRALLENSVLGNMNAEIVGWTWLFAGVVFGTLAGLSQ